jgi:hypothetical protein
VSVGSYNDLRLHASAPDIIGIKVQLSTCVSEMREQIRDVEFIVVFEVHVRDSARSGIGERQDRERKDETERTPLDRGALVILLLIFVLHLDLDADEGLLVADARFDLGLHDVEQYECSVLQQLVTGEAFLLCVIHGPDVDLLGEPVNDRGRFARTPQRLSCASSSASFTASR